MIEASPSAGSEHVRDLTLAMLVPRRSWRRNALLAAVAALLLAGAWAAPWVLQPSVVPAAQAGMWVALPGERQVVIMTNLEPTGWPFVEIHAVQDVPGAHVAHAWVVPDASIRGDVVTDAASYPTGLEYLRAKFPDARFGSSSEVPQRLGRGESSQLFIWTVPGFMDTGLGGEFVNAPIA